MMRIIEFFGFKIIWESKENILRDLADLAKSGKCVWVVTLNWEMMARCLLYKNYNKLLLGCDYCCADGFSIVALSRLSGARSLVRCDGVFLVEGLVNKQLALKVTIVGGESSKIRSYLSSRDLNLINFNFWDGWYDQRVETNLEILRLIKNHGSNLVLIALGVPKQDRLAEFLRDQNIGCLVMAIGGSFDLLSKSKHRAPILMQQYGLEWLFRLAQEPSRLWRRYLILYPVGFILFAWKILTKSRFP